MKPKRIQRKRTKGWRMPANTVYVGRPGRYGNTFKIGDPHPAFGHPMTREEAIEMFEWGAGYFDWPELRGKDLACWCRLDQPCHADALLEIANRKATKVKPKK